MKNEEHNSNGNHYLMRNLSIGPDYTAMSYDIPMKWFQEICFKSMEVLPKALLDEPHFSEIKVDNTRVYINSNEWFEFMGKLTSIFRKNSEYRKKVINNVNMHLNEYEVMIDEALETFEKDKRIESNRIKLLFDKLAIVDSFAIFNMIIPKEYYNKLFVDLGFQNGEINLDDLLTSMVVPHRTQVRIRKLELALAILKDKENYEKLLKCFMENELIFDNFESWCFDDLKLIDDRYVRREIKKISDCYTETEIKAELESIKKKREISFVKFENALGLIEDKMKSKLLENQVEDVLEKVLLLSMIATEEEKRHMIECKHFILIGKLMSTLQLDPGRSSILDILNNSKFKWS